MRYSQHQETFQLALENIKKFEHLENMENVKNYCDLCTWAGRAYLAGWCCMKPCSEKAAKYFTKAAKKSCCEAWTILAAGHCHGWIENPCFQTGMNFYAKGVHLGCPLACKQLGDMYMNKKGDFKKALFCYLRYEEFCSVKNGHSHYITAVALDNGFPLYEHTLKQSGKTNLDIAIQLYTLAHALSHIPATLTLAVHLEQLYPEKQVYKNVDKDIELSVKMYEWAIRRGSFAACISLCAKIALIKASNIVGRPPRLSNMELDNSILRFCPSTDEYYYFDNAKLIIDAYADEDPCFPNTSELEHELIGVQSAIARAQLLLEYEFVQHWIKSALATCEGVPTDIPTEQDKKTLETVLHVIDMTLLLTPSLTRKMLPRELKRLHKSEKKRERKKRNKAYKKNTHKNKSLEEQDALLAAMLEDVDLIDPLTGEFYVYSSDSE